MAKGKSKVGTTMGSSGSVIGGGSLPAATNQVTPPTPAQIAKGNTLPKGGVAFSQFETMTDDQKADVINTALRTGIPMFLDDSGLQRFAYFTGMSDKPTVVSDAKLDSISGKEIYRTVYDGYNSRTDIGYTGNDVVKQIRNGDFTMYSDSGGSAHGKGIYFASDYRDSALYGMGQRNPIITRAKITSNKVITENKLNSDFNSAVRRGDKLATACNSADYSSARNLYALAKGYDVVSASNGYHMVLNRRALTMSDKVKPATGYSW